MIATLTPTDAWQAAQVQLSLELTKSTYNSYVSGARLVEYTPAGGYIISVPNQYAQEWLDKRLKTTVTRAIENATGEQAEISFIVANQPPPPSVPLPAHTSNQPVENDAYPAGNARERSLQSPDADIIDLYKTGWTPASDYCTVFWQSYLNGLTRNAWNIWHTVASFDKRNIFKQIDTYWTPPKRFYIRELASVVGGSAAGLTGRPTVCNRALNALREGTPLTECCGRHHPAKFGSPITLGNGITGPACHYWYTGALEMLFNEGLLMAEVQRHGDHPRQHRLRLQVWRLLPVLTPAQVDTLSVAVQKEHTQWIVSHAHTTGLSLHTWEAITADTLVKSLPGHNEPDLLSSYSPSLSFIKEAVIEATSDIDD